MPCRRASLAGVFDAIILAGGAARRLGGTPKPEIVVAGRTLLDRVLDAVADAGQIIVAGPAVPTGRPVRWVREDPPGTGPVAAIAAALTEVGAPRLVLLAADLPQVAPAVPVLLSALPGADAAVLSRDGRANYVAAAWRTEALRASITGIGPGRGAALGRVYETAHVVQVPDEHGWGRDCDTWDDVRRARAELTE